MRRPSPHLVLDPLYTALSLPLVGRQNAAYKVLRKYPLEITRHPFAIAKISLTFVFDRCDRRGGIDLA